MIPHQTPWLVKKVLPSLVWDIPNKSNTIYLTFDDGPIPEVTPWVLDVLEEYNAKATFFCIGENVERNPDIFKRILAQNHAVGNHTNRHLNAKTTSLQAYLTDTKKCDEVFLRHGVHTRMFRPPYGRTNMKLRRSLQRPIVMWDILTKDYDLNTEPSTALQKCIKHTKAGSIVLFHDSLKAETNLRYILPKFLKHFASKNYSFAKLEL